MKPNHPAGVAEALVRVEDLSISFRVDRGEKLAATKNVSFSIPPNSTVGLVGESGSGKSVSALAIMGLLPTTAEISPQSRVFFRGMNLLFMPAGEMRAIRGKDIAMIFQEPMSSLNPVFPVGEQIGETLRLHLHLSKAQARSRAIELLNDVGIAQPQQRLASYPHELSGGQQQRVMIAMAMACEPKLLIADEPTTALDVTIQRQILDLLQRLRLSHRMSVLFISHDLSLVSNIADQVVVMQAGEVREAGAAREVLGAPQHGYTRALLACRPRLDRRPHRLPTVADVAERDDFGDLNATLQRRRGTQQDDVTILEVRQLRKTFRLRDGWWRKRALEAVRGVSFRLPRGKTVGLVGESGCGKSTLALALVRLHAPNGGEVLFDGVDVMRLRPDQFMAYRKRIQIVFQNPYASLNPRFSVGQLLLEPMRLHGIGIDDSQREQRALGWLSKVGLDASALHKYPHEFSGGQRQRIAIARCLTVNPEVLICDEAVSALDVSVQAQVLNLLQDLQDELGLSYLFISHDLAVVRHVSDHILVMRDGEIVEAGDSDSVTGAPQHDYTKQLLAAVPQFRA